MKRQKLNPSLPEDVMMEILNRLPLESVLALKRVSKQWKDLINDPKFFTHYRDDSHALFVAKDGLYCSLVKHRKETSDAVDGGGHPPFTMHHIPVGSNALLDDQWSNMTVCNWMTYVVTRRGDFLLYNLLTGASYTVKDAPLREHSFAGHTRWVCHGLGYDVCEDDYKILVVCDHKYGGWMVRNKLSGSVQKEDNSVFWVYSLRNRAWKRLEGFPYAAYGWDSGDTISRPCSLNGVLHWCLRTRGDPSRTVIITYDLHTCKFGEISLPEGYKHNRSWSNVSELGGLLCCCDRIYVWVMEEYGVCESWTVLSYNLGCSVAPAVLYECEDGRDMLLYVDNDYGTLCWYDKYNDERIYIHQSTWRKRGVIGARKRKHEECFIGSDSRLEVTSQEVSGSVDSAF